LLSEKLTSNKTGTSIMRIFAIALLMLAATFATVHVARAQSSCKDCADQQKACMKNYAGPTCKSEYQICMKSCKK
jgi:hypothetical protein